VLTSSQSLSLLEEKAQKKKAEAERKAKRKQEMDEKKRQREILKRKREEEKAVKDGSRKGKQRARESSDEVTYWKKLEKTGLNVHAVDGYMKIVYIMTLLLIPAAGREYVPTVFCRLRDVFF
jgi:hypothetical protein